VFTNVVIPVSRTARTGARIDLLFLALAALGAYGWTRLMRGRPRSVTTIATLIMAALLLGEFHTRMDAWLAIPKQPAEVYRWLARQPRSVVAEVPLARADRLHSISDGIYMYNSTWHWQPIVNGYSGFFPKTFIELSEATVSFPDDRSIAYLKQRGVDLLVVHGALIEARRVWGNDRKARGTAGYRGAGPVPGTDGLGCGLPAAAVARYAVALRAKASPIDGPPRPTSEHYTGPSMEPLAPNSR
jgi:hypothetical protein